MKEILLRKLVVEPQTRHAISCQIHHGERQPKESITWHRKTNDTKPANLTFTYTLPLLTTLVLLNY